MRNQAEASLSALIESTEDHIWAVDLAYRLTVFNRAFQLYVEHIHGVQPAVGMRPEDMFPPARAAAWPLFFERALKDGPCRVEHVILDGRTLEFAFNPIVVNDKIVGISVFGKDITQRKEAEVALQKAEKRYRDIFDGALEGMFQQYPADGSLTVNGSLAKMMGYDSPNDLKDATTEIIRNMWADPNDQARFSQQIYEHGAVRDFECRLKRKDGSVIWVSLNCRRVGGADGRATSYEGFIEDVSERKRAEITLRESAESLLEAQKIGRLGSYVLSFPAGSWTGSDVLDEIFGIGKDYDRTVAGWTALVHPDDRAMMASYLAGEVFAKRKPFDKEYRIVRQADGNERWVNGMGKLTFDAQGQPLKMSGMIKDVTERKLAEMQLRDSEERYRSTFEQAAVGIIHTSFDGIFLRCNPRFAEIVGYPPDQIPGMSFQQVTSAEDLAKSVAVLQTFQADANKSATFEKRYLKQDGTLTWAKLTISTQRDAEGKPLHCIGIVEDINDRKLAEERLAATQNALRVSEERYRTAFHTSLDSITINRLSDGTYTDVNRAFLQITGYERDEVIGKSSLELNTWADPADRLKLVEALQLNSVCENMEVRFRMKDGTLVWGLMSASLIEIDGATCVLSVTRDISKAKAAEEQIRDLAFYDPLTHLPNRRLLLERSKQPQSTPNRNRRRRALLIVDLDGFKILNDTLGHPAGDLMLQEVARRLVTCIREPDTVARLGGDEFVVMLEDLSEIPEEAAAQSEVVGEKILSALSQQFWISGRECVSTCSIGIAVFGAQLEATNDVLQKAEIALGQAKAAGGDTMRFFAPALQAAVNDRAAMQEDLREAIRSNQFVLYYQPQVDSTGWIGAEALIRWKHPRRGLVFPDEFIPLAEETGLILPIGNWVLEAACSQITAWSRRKETAQLGISVNISALQFRQPEFVDQILAALHRTGADRSHLELEITESMLLENIEDVIAKMTCLKGHGLRFSLDDFGTGYSSLTYLKRLPLDQLKIDRSFVRDILIDDSSAAIAQTIISLSNAMGLSVIAEGVETEEQRLVLAGLGCHAFQGYLFSRPLPLREFELLWRNSESAVRLPL